MTDKSVPRLSGVIPVLATPFSSDGELSVPSLRRLVGFVLSAPANALAIFGIAGETSSLSLDERLRMQQVVAEEVEGRIPVIAGVSASTVEGAIEQAQIAARGGADVVMVMPPTTDRASSGDGIGLEGFYRHVHDACGIPVMVQDAPKVTGVEISPEMMARLALIEGVDYAKVEDQPTPPKIREVSSLVGDGFGILGGMNAMFFLEEMACGAVGTMPACEFTDMLAGVLEPWEKGDQPAARERFNRLLPLIRFGLQPGISWAVHKEVLVRRGIIESSVVRPPAKPLDPASKAALNTIVEDLSIFYPELSEVPIGW